MTDQLPKEDERTKIKISMPGVEIDYEGPQSFVQDTLMRVVERLASVAPKAVAPAAPDTQTIAAPAASSALGNLTTSTIASRLRVDSGPELIMAAIARIIFVNGAQTATRSQILDEMRTANEYYKATYLGNLTAYLNGLVRKQRLNNVGKDTYSLPSGERATLEKSIAQPL